MFKTEPANLVPVKIDDLFDVILHRGFFKTGDDIYVGKDKLLMPGDLIVNETELLVKAKKFNLTEFTINKQSGGGVWDKAGKSIIHKYTISNFVTGSVEKKINDIVDQNREVEVKVGIAKSCVKKVISNIRANGGRFDKNEVENTVNGLIDIISENKNPYSIMAKNIINYDEYLLNHSINVCTIGTAVLYKMNSLFNEIDDRDNKNKTVSDMLSFKSKPDSKNFYTNDHIKRIATGFFLHDIGKVTIDERLLNKNGPLSEEEFKTVKKHSYEYGREILKINGIHDPLIKNSVIYHHCPIYENEMKTYPQIENHKKVPLYVRICKLSDIYDAMTSKRSYKEAVNPTEVVTSIFKKYSTRCDQLQLILHSFLKSIGSIPAGSVVTLKNKQKAFILNSDGPVVILLTDIKGEKLNKIPEPIALNEKGMGREFEIDRKVSVKSLHQSIPILPGFIRKVYNG